MDETFEPHKHVTLRNLLIAGAVLLLALLIGGFVFLYNQNSPTQISQEKEVSLESLNTDPNYAYTEVLRTDGHSFLCRERRYTESACVLFVLENSTTTYLGISTDNPSRALLPSPDKKYLLVVTEHTGLLIDTASLAKKVVIETSADQELGVFTGLPSFLPKARWLDPTHLEFSIYKAGSLDDLSPSPVEKKVVDISLTMTSPTFITMPKTATAVHVNELGLGFFKDSDGVYQRTQDGVVKLNGINPTTFAFLGWNDQISYLRDNAHIFVAHNYTSSIIVNADLATFTLVYDSELAELWNDPLAICSNCNFDAQDKNHKYLQGEIVQ